MIDITKSFQHARLIVIQLFKHEGEHVLVDVAILMMKGVLPRYWDLLNCEFFSLLPQISNEEVSRTTS